MKSTSGSGKLVLHKNPFGFQFRGSVLSAGNLWIVIAIVVLVIVGVAALVVVKKKKKPATANGADKTGEE